MTKGRKMICSRIETKVRRNRKNRVSSALGRGGPVVIALWALLICAFAFAVYKDFTAVDTHTVHETTVVPGGSHGHECNRELCDQFRQGVLLMGTVCGFNRAAHGKSEILSHGRAADPERGHGAQ